MQKLILLVDPGGIDKALLEFASLLASLGNVHLHGLFLHSDKPVAGQDSKKQFLGYFKNQSPRVIPGVSDAFTNDQIIEETRFADAIIISADATFNGSPKATPSRLTAYILKNAECPVIVAPLSSMPIDEVVFAYDGSPSSVFAAKEFTRVFPQFEDKKVTFLEVKSDGSSSISHQEKFTDYLKMHYSSIGYRVLHGEAENELFGYFLEKKNTFLVLGAFSRSPVSTLIHRSSASLLLKTTSLPLFIAHR
jgi:hypothetical protein